MGELAELVLALSLWKILTGVVIMEVVQFVPLEELC